MRRSEDFVRLSKAARVYNVSLKSIVDFLATKGIEVDRNPNTRLDLETYNLLESVYGKNDDSTDNNWVRTEFIPDNHYDENEIPEVVSIWNLITNSAKTRFNYSEFESDFDEAHNHIPHNLIWLIISGFTSDKSHSEIVAILHMEMLTIGLVWDKEGIIEFVKDKDVVFKNEIELARKTNKLLDNGEPPASILNAFDLFLNS